MLILIQLISGILLFFSCIVSDPIEKTSLYVMYILPFIYMVSYYVWNTMRFSHMIDEQRKHYDIDLTCQNPMTISRLSAWIICSDYWLIQPGKIALYKKHICKVSIIESSEKGGIFYHVMLKTMTGNQYKLTCRHKDTVKKIRAWAS